MIHTGVEFCVLCNKGKLRAIQYSVEMAINQGPVISA